MKSFSFLSLCYFSFYSFIFFLSLFYFYFYFLFLFFIFFLFFILFIFFVFIFSFLSLFYFYLFKFFLFFLFFILIYIFSLLFLFFHFYFFFSFFFIFIFIFFFSFSFLFIFFYSSFFSFFFGARLFDIKYICLTQIILYRSIWSINGTFTGTVIGPGSNDNEGIFILPRTHEQEPLHLLQFSIIPIISLCGVVVSLWRRYNHHIQKPHRHDRLSVTVNSRKWKRRPEFKSRVSLCTHAFNERHDSISSQL